MPNNIEVWLINWASTYFVHSTLLFCLAWLVSRWHRNPAIQEMIWKGVLVGAVLTTTLQIGIGTRTPLSFVAFPTYSVTPTDNPVITASTQAQPSITAIPTPTTNQPTSIPVTEQWFPLLLNVWGVTVFLGMLRLAWHYHHFYQQLGQRHAVKNGGLYTHLKDLCQQLSIPIPRLSLTSTKISPLLLPTGEICLPDAVQTALSVEEQRGVLAHEIAHKVRGDHHWRLVTQIFTILLPFQPLLWVAQRELHRTAEHLSDGYAVKLLGSPLPLVNGLVQIATWLKASKHSLPVSAMASDPSSLRERVQRLLYPLAFRPFDKVRWLLRMGGIGIALSVMLPPITVMTLPLNTKGTPPDLPKPLITPTEHSTRTSIPSVITSTPSPRRTPVVRPTVALPPPAMWPVDGQITVQPSTYHMAIDIAGEAGTPIVAAWDGTVTAAGYDNTGYGYRVMIKHSDGYATLYAHLEAIVVEKGDVVGAGDIIGTRGATGRVTGPTLHFEVRLNGVRVNPWNYLP